jgi:peptide-methionine (R)-S-oxide reductase
MNRMAAGHSTKIVSKALSGCALLALMGGAAALANPPPRPSTRNPLRLAVLRLGMTEPAWTSPLNREKRAGMFTCAGCGAPLFPSTAKFESGTGWPSFYASADKEGSLAFKKEWDGRIECRCKACGGHLGHAFADGPRPEELKNGGGPVPKGDLQPTNGRRPRYCINGLAITFSPDEA